MKKRRWGVRSLKSNFFVLALVGMSCFGLLAPAAASSSPPSDAYRFFHDPDGRLKAAIDPEGDTAIYHWDPAGNLLSISRHASSKLSIVQLSPSRGEVGATVTIEGTAFSSMPTSNSVKFNGTAATVIAASATALTVKVPSGATTGPVTVAVGADGPVEGPGSFTVSEPSAPQVSSLSPTIAIAGEDVTASGSNFDPAIPGNLVTLNGLVSNVETASPSSIKFEVPQSRLGGHVSITTAEGTGVGPDLFVPPKGVTAASVDATVRFSLGASKSIGLTGGKVALLLFDGAAGEAVSLVLSGATLGGSASIWSPTGTQLTGSATGFAKGGTSVAGPVTLPETGTYTVLVGGSEAGSGTVSMASYGFQHVTGSIVPSLEGAQRSVSIPVPGQEARYTIAGTAGQGISLKTTSSALSGSYEIKLLNPSGHLVKGWTHSGAQNSLHEAVGFSTTGYYTLVIDPVSAATGTLDMTVWDGIYDAGTITPSSAGASQTLPLKVPGGATEATFSGSAGQRILFSFGEIGFNGFVGIHSPKDKAFAGSEGSLGKGGSRVLEMTLPETGTYTLWLIQGASNGETGSVKATAYAPPADVAGTIAPSEEGAQKSPSLTSAGQNAVYSVSATAGQAASLKTSSSAMSGSYKLEWLNPSGGVIKSWTNTGSQNVLREAVTFPTTGTYSLVVNPEGTATGSVTLTVWDATIYDAGTIVPNSEGTSKTLPLKVPNGTTKATFSGTAGQRILFNFSEITFPGFVGIHKPSGGAFMGSEGSLSKGGSRLLEMTLPETGTYTVWLIPTSGETGSVKATAYAPPADVAGTIAPSEEGAQKSPSLTSVGQNAVYSVSATAGQAASLKTSSSAMSGPYALEWLNPSGGVIKSWTNTGSQNVLREAVTFSTTGTYTLVVNPEGTATGSVTLTVWDASVYDAGTVTPTTEGSAKTLPLKVPGGTTKATFSGTAGQKLKFAWSEITFNAFTAIHTPKAKTLSSSEASLSKGGSKVVTPVALPETGTYTIWFIPGSASGETGSAKLTSYIEPTIAWPSLAGPTPMLVAQHGLTGPDVYSDIPASGATGPQVDNSNEGDRVRPGLSEATPVDSASLHWLPSGARDWHPWKHGAWLPPRSSLERGWVVKRPVGPWAKLAPLEASEGETAVTGQVLRVDGVPIAGVKVSLKGTSIVDRTDRTGRFLLSGTPAGRQVLVINGETARSKQRYGSFEAGVDLLARKTTALDYTVWMTALDKAGSHRIASPTKGETTVTTPRIPGFEVKLPAGTVVRNAAGDPVKHLNITAIPVNRPAFPLPPFLSVPLYFTVQPGRAYLSKGAQVIYPNWGHLPPGQRVDFWNYDPTDQGWHVYGRGEVTANGKQVVPDPGVRVWQFTGAMVVSSPPPPAEAPPLAGLPAVLGDPVDLATGLFVYQKADLSLPGPVSISVERTYRPGDSNSYSFGRGMTSLYDLRLWSTNSEDEADLILPDGGRVHFVRTSPGSGESDAVFKAENSPSAFSGAKIYSAAEGSGWELTLKNGLTFVFNPFVLAPLREIRDRFGNRVILTRSGEAVTRISDSNGRGLELSYDFSNRVTEITDNANRHVKYTYTEGNLTKVEGLAGRTTEYEYDGSNRMRAIVNARGNKYLQIGYDANGRVEKQTMGDGGIFEFDYELGESGDVESTTVTDPLGRQRVAYFNADGYVTSETVAPGSPLAETKMEERQPETGLLLSRTDALGHETEFEYDGSGNLTEVTELAGTEDAVTTEFEYEPNTDRVTKVTDPLGHASEFAYGDRGELLSKVDPLGHETTYAYDDRGRRTSVTNPEGEELRLRYSLGDLVSITDPLGRTTERFVDALGRVAAVTTPAGRRTRYLYNDAGEVIKVISPSGAETSFAYDADGNVTTIADALGHETTRSYDVMDRLSTETDPLESSRTWTYDKAGDLIAEEDRNGDIATFAYDALRRLTGARYGVSGESADSSVAYAYDSLSRLIGVDDSAAGEYALGYDDLGRLTALETPEGSTGYAYDDAGRRTNLFVSDIDALAYEFDAANRLTHLSRGSDEVSLSYDKADRLAAVTLPDDVVQSYEYDEAGEPVSISYEDGEEALGEIEYAYDQDGLLEATWGSSAHLDLPAPLESTDYNDANELVEQEGVPLEYDGEGNLLDDGTKEYSWDSRGQLTSISGATSASFTYDPFGRRISKTLGGTTTDLLFDGRNVVRESVEGDVTASLMTGLEADQIFARTTEAGMSSFLTDRLGSTVALADEGGEITTSYTYDPFGTPTSSGAVSDNPYQFTGRENDGTGLQYNRARYYSPSQGRFVSQDPAGFGGSGTNLYWYASNDPVDYIDPTGEYTVPGGFSNIGEPSSEGESVGSEIGDLIGSFYEAATGNESWKQDKKLTPGEIRRLKENGIDPHDYKERGHSDLYKKPDGDIVEKPPGGRGPGDPIGINIKELK